jgi:hypothetical protein
MPALKAARTAFNFPCVKRAATASTRLFFTSETEDLLPRRCCSASAAESNRSRSWSSSRLIAPGRSFGRTSRGEGAVATSVVVGEDGGFADGEERSRVDALENRSGVVDGLRALPICRSCRHRDQAAMGSVSYVVPNGTSEIQYCEIYLSINDLWLLGRLAKYEPLAILTRAPREHYLAKIKVAATTGKACNQG